MANLVDLAYALSIGPHYLWHRFITGKYGPKTQEKTGEIPDRFSGAITRVLGRGDPHYEPPCLWVHAVSVGEVNSSKDLVRRFLADNPLWELRVSTTTATGRKVAIDLYGEECVFYYPLDFSWMVKKALKRVRPSLIVLMELEIWPNFLREAREQQLAVTVANARITERSLKRLAKVPSLAKSMAGAIEEWYAQTETYAKRLETIGVPPEHIEVLGSIKYDSVPDEVDDWAGKRYRRLFGCDNAANSILIVAGSTHPGEEQAVLEAWSTVKKADLPAKLLLVPRHPERLGQVEELARRYGGVVRRSALADPKTDKEAPLPVEAEIILGDTMGELAKFYTAADLVFVGGTLTNRGGQNFIEPCGLGKPTVIGPNVWNFSEPAELLTANKCIRMVKDAEELKHVFPDLLTHRDEAKAMGKRARELLLQQRGAAERIVDRLDALASRILMKMRQQELEKHT